MFSDTLCELGCKLESLCRFSSTAELRHPEVGGIGSELEIGCAWPMLTLSAPASAKSFTRRRSVERTTTGTGHGDVTEWYSNCQGLEQEYYKNSMTFCVPSLTRRVWLKALTKHQLACQPRQSFNGWRAMPANSKLSRISKNMPPTPYTVSNLELMTLKTQILVLVRKAPKQWARRTSHATYARLPK